MDDAVPGLDPGSQPVPSGSPVVDWITQATTPGRTVHAAIPPGYASYATVVVGDSFEAKSRADAALVDVLVAHSQGQRWCLGYLDTGVADVVHDIERTAVYQGWSYVVVSGDGAAALTSRSNEDGTPWHSALPELLFPEDRSWLVSTMWDDDWRCVGGPVSLVEALVASPVLDARVVSPDEDATPPAFRDA